MALTGSFTSYPIVGSPVGLDFHVVVEFSSAIDPTTLVGTDFRLRSQLGTFHNPSNDQVDFYTDDNTTFLVVFHFTGNLGGSQQYLVRLPMNRIQYVDENGVTQSGPDATINTPFFNIQIGQELTATISFADSEGAAGTATIATILFNQPVSGVNISDFSIADGTLGDLTVVSSSRYTVPVTPSASGDGTLTLTFAADGTYEGNPEATADLPYTGGGTPTPANNAPSFGESSYSFSDIAIAVNTVVGSVVATDADNDTLSYSLTGTDANNFAIDSNGQITVATALTHSSTYNFNVVADDQTDTTSVAVTVTAIAAAIPVIPVTLGWEVPTEAVGNIFSVILTSTHALTGLVPGDLRLRDDDNSDPAIAINTGNTTITAIADTNNWLIEIALTGTYDDDYTIRINGETVQANGMNVPAAQLASAAFRIDSSTGATNNAPSFGESSYAFTDIAIAVGTVVGTVAATDDDADDTISYSLTGANASNFNIDSNGQITVATALAHSTTYNFNVVADDQTDTTSVRVTVTATAAPPPPPPVTDAVLDITVNPNSVTAGGIATVTFRFDKLVGGFTDAVVDVSAGATKGVLTDEENNVWILPVTAPSSGSGTVTVSVDADVVTPGNNADSVQFAYTAPAPPPPRVRSVPRFTTAPMDVKVELTPTTALITWKAPTNGASLTEYEISYAEGASPGTDWIPTESLSTWFLVKRLKRGTQYTWQVRGVTESGTGTASRPVTERTPIASLHNALFFKECINYFDDGGRVSVYGNASNIIRAVADNNYRTFTREKDLVLNIAVGGNPTRVDAIFVKGIDIEGHSAAPNGGTGVGYSNRMMPATVKNWEGTDVSTIVNGFSHDLYLLDQHFTATSVRLTFTGANAKIVEVMLLEFGISIDTNGDFTEIATNFVDREGVVHPDPGGGIVYDPPIGSDDRDKWEVDYVVKIVPGKTMLETPEEFLYWRAENRNHVFCMEPSRFPWRIFPAVFVGKSVPIRYRTDSKTSGEILSFRVAEQ